MKYLLAYTVPLVVCFSLNTQGWLTYSAVIYIFGIIPLIELLIPINTKNKNTDEKQSSQKASFYFDWLLYLNLPIQLALLFWFCYSSATQPYTLIETIGRIFAMGMACGILGINVAHELGHRTTWYERLIAQVLLLSSLYLHFYIEHNRGHHKYVATLKDPATARYGEPIYVFWIRSIIKSYTSAWHIQADLLTKNQKSFFSYHNTMLLFQIAQILLTTLIGLCFTWPIAFYFMGASLVGILLLETVNYIEHYGLLRNATSATTFERVMPCHSWNSDHQIGRLMLYELTRHSDHHYLASRKYQLLRHFDDSPQLPFGYPACMVISLFPPLWYRLIHPQLTKIKAETNK